MAALDRYDAHFLDILVEWEVLQPEQADSYEERFLKYRRNHPDARLAEILESKGLVHPDDIDAALDEVEQRIADEDQAREQRAPRRPAAKAPRRKAPGPKAPVSKAHRPAGSYAHHPHAPKADNTVPLVFGIVIVVVGLIAAVVFLTGDSGQAPQQQASNTTESGADPAATDDDADDEDFQLRKFERQMREIGSLEPKEKEAALQQLAVDAPRRFAGEVGAELARVREDIDRSARVLYPSLEDRADDATTIRELRSAHDKIDKFLEEFGESTMGGEPSRLRDSVLERLEEACKRGLAAAEEAYDEGDYDKAIDEFGLVAESGITAREQAAKRGIRKVERRQEGGSTVAKASAKDDDDAGTASEGREVAKASPKKDDEKSKAKERSRSGVDRITVIRPKLSLLCPSNKATLGNDGMFSISYDFEQKRYRDGQDWSPELEEGRQSHQSAIRWTMYQEEIVIDGMTGVRVSDRGVWRHNVKLMPPVNVDVVYYPMNQFQKRNQFCVAWVTEKGLGVGSNMGVVTGLFKSGAFTKPSAPLTAIDGFVSHVMGLTVTDNGFAGKSKRRQTPKRALPKKLTSGFVAFVFRNDVAGTIQSVSIRGKLDLDWAEKELFPKRR